MKACERFLKYIKFDTKSDEHSGKTPSSEGQSRFAEYLRDELISLGATNVKLDANSYVSCRIPATVGFEKAPTVGFISHMDTSPDFSGQNVNARIIKNYNGENITLGNSGRVLSVTEFPHLKSLCGRTLITTDGTTLLGADDKAGIAEIMTAVEHLLNDDIPHGDVCICFTPDEEIGEGADHFDIDNFGASAAYTVDGSAEGEIEFENFNAYGAKFSIVGRNIHPGDAKGKMINAALVGAEIISLIPACETPANTEGYEGFYHLCSVEGCCENCTLDYIVRDHDEAMMLSRLNTLRRIEKTLCEKYGSGCVTLELREQYRNMKEIVESFPHVISIARDAIKECGLEPIQNPVRGGTDGARISYMGIPCPNLGTGGYAFHGPFEHITAEGMDICVDIIIGIVKRYAERR